MFENQDVEKKVIAILQILGGSPEPQGSMVIARRLKNLGIALSERAVRYHLRLMDERGLTRLIGRRNGRVLTERGLDETNSARVRDKVGFIISKIEGLAFRTNFDYEKHCGTVPVNISFFPEKKFNEALKIMKPIFGAGICVSDLVGVASAGEKLGERIIPDGKVGFATVCSIVINGCLLKAGVPMDSRFGGILQIHNHKPVRFVELIQYADTSLDPSEVFIRAKMTAVREVFKTGDGKILANFREIPALCRPVANQVAKKLQEVRLGGLILMGDASEPVCEIPMELNKIGVVLTGGLNPVAAATEAGIEIENHSMSTVMEYENLIKFDDFLGKKSKCLN